MEAAMHSMSSTMRLAEILHTPQAKNEETCMIDFEYPKGKKEVYLWLMDKVMVQRPLKRKTAYHSFFHQICLGMFDKILKTIQVSTVRCFSAV